MASSGRAPYLAGSPLRPSGQLTLSFHESSSKPVPLGQSSPPLNVPAWQYRPLAHLSFRDGAAWPVGGEARGEGGGRGGQPTGSKWDGSHRHRAAWTGLMKVEGGGRTRTAVSLGALVQVRAPAVRPVEGRTGAGRAVHAG